ncbi:MAG: Asp23/Gls24 family envelope stress response protein [Actinomycetota bacterium]|nr:Asp23/Gls24 family envelope stress response protein [Actinomycetota bacterium]
MSDLITETGGAAPAPGGAEEAPETTRVGASAPPRVTLTGASGINPASTSGGPGGLRTERGQTTIAEVVVLKVAGIAAREVGGVYALGGGVARALGAVTQRLSMGESNSQGVSVEVGEREAAVDLTVVVEYGESIPRVAQQIRENVIRRIEGITGLGVTEVNVAVVDLYLPGEDQPENESARVS